MTTGIQTRPTTCLAGLCGGGGVLCVRVRARACLVPPGVALVGSTATGIPPFLPRPTTWPGLWVSCVQRRRFRCLGVSSSSGPLIPGFMRPAWRGFGVLVTRCLVSRVLRVSSVSLACKRPRCPLETISRPLKTSGLRWRVSFTQGGSSPPFLLCRGPRDGYMRSLCGPPPLPEAYLPHRGSDTLNGVGRDGFGGGRSVRGRACAVGACARPVPLTAV